MKQHIREQIVASVGTYPPTVCGVGTFTSNVASATAAPGTGWHSTVIRVLEADEVRVRGGETVQWVAGDRASMSLAVSIINEADAMLLQHEYGLFGGEDGDEINQLLELVDIPIVSVLHTVLTSPSAHQRQVIEDIMARSSKIVVPSLAAQERLLAAHDVSADKVVVIPHGAVANFRGPVDASIPHPMILTWGLLGPGKGVEHGIRALALMTDLAPAVHYVVAGATHPKVLETYGEEYRDTLMSLAERLGVLDRLHLDDGYRSWEALRALVRSADVVLLPYDTKDQVSSGVLVEALASGKPVVATRFPQAVELLSGGAGIVVDQGDEVAMAQALEGILGSQERAREMSDQARLEGEKLLWGEVGSMYRQVLAEVTGN